MKNLTFDEFKDVSKNATCVVAFGAPWCKDCKIAMPMLMELSSKYSKTVEFYGVDIDKEEGIRDAMSIRHIPTIVFLKGGDEVCDRVVEPRSIDEIEDCIKKLI